MFVSRNLVAGLGLLAASSLGAGSAAAATVSHGFVTTSLHLRAGPGTNYPVVTTMRSGDRVSIYGCLSGWNWCDIGWHGYRGWAAGRYLQVTYRSHRRPISSYGHYLGLPFLSFSIGSYWGDHYRDRRFYRDRSRYDHHRGNRPPPHNGRPPHNGGPPHDGRPPHNGGPPHDGRPPHNGRPPHDGRPPHNGGPRHDKGPRHDGGFPHNGRPPHSGPPPHAGRPPHNGTPPHMGRPPRKGPPNAGNCLPGQKRVHGVCQ